MSAAPLVDARDRGGPAQPLLRVRGLVKHFPLKKSFFGGADAVVRAVDDVDFDVLKGETLGVVGESGCGKSTTARLLMQLITPDAGQTIFDGEPVASGNLGLRHYRRQVQMVFQDSYSSLNPRLTVEASVAFGPQVHGVPKKEATARARSLLARVGPPEDACLDGKVFCEAAHRHERLGGAAAVAGIDEWSGAHVFTSMAERSPSEKRLKEMDVMKIISPGSAAIQGCT